MDKITPDDLRAAFWKDDFEHGGVIRSQYDEIKGVLESINIKWVEEQYRKVKRQAIEQTDFYRDYMENDEFPIMDKMSLLEHYEEHTSKGGFTTPVHVSSTSGSTGTPFSVIQDYKKRKRTIADLKVFGELCDYPSHERMLFFRVINDRLHRTSEQENRENIYYIDSSNLGKDHLEEMLQAILDKKPRIIFSYSSTLVELAKYIIANRNLIKFSMVSILTGGEGISEENRKLLEHVFGCKVYRRYSDMELGILGQDMGEGGAYTLNWGSYFFECLRVDSNQPTESGEEGRIVITDLFNYAFPMIRYDTGDLGVMEYSTGGSFPTLKEIYGRSRDCIYSVDGTLLSPAKIFVIMWQAENIKQWQFIQETENSYILKLNCEGVFDCTSIIENFKNILGKRASVEVQYVKGIPVVSSNKRRAVICNYKKGD